MKQMNSIERFSRLGKNNYTGLDILKNHIFQKHPVCFTDDMDDYSQVEKYDSEYVWLVKTGTELSSKFPYGYKTNTKNVICFTYMYKGNRKVYSWDLVKLIPNSKDRITEPVKEKIIVGHYDAWKGKDHFDIFLCGSEDTASYKSLQEKYNFKTVQSFEEAQTKSETDMFWFIPDDVEVYSSFNMKRYVPDEWSMNFTHVFGNDKLNEFDGIGLFPKKYTPTEKELDFRFYVNKKEIKLPASKRSNYPVFYVDTFEDYQNALQQSNSELFWIMFPNVEADINFNFDITFKITNVYDRQTNHAFKHVVDNEETYDGIWLCSKHVPISKNEIEHRHIVDRKEWDIVASGPKYYNKFFIDTYDEYLHALNTSETEMFWGVSKNLKVDPNFKFDLFFDDRTDEFEYERNENHTFIHKVNNENFYNGIFLFSKNKEVSQREIEHRHLTTRKEWDIVASGPVKYDIFDVNNYDDYLFALHNSKTEMFWAKSGNVSVFKEFHYDLYFTHDQEYERNINHAFAHMYNNEKTYHGLFLFTKHKPLSEREINNRYIIEAKHHPVFVSQSIVYDIFEIDSWDEYQYALTTSKTEMFWATSKNIKVDPKFKFSLFFDPKDDEYEYERKENHAFIHKVNDEILYNGIFLFSKHKPVTQQEIEHRHILERKEWSTVASGPLQYDIFAIDTWLEYDLALQNSKTEMFWATSRNIDTSNFDFDLYFTHDNHYDRFTNHAFIHNVDGKEYYNGLFLMSCHNEVSKHEIESRHIIDRKEWDIVASGPIKYDVFTVDSYEDYLDAVDKSTTEMFWAVSSNVDTSEFDFDLYFTHDNEYDRYINHVFKHEVDDDVMFNGVFLLTKNIKK